MSAQAAPVTAARKRKSMWAAIGGVVILAAVIGVVAFMMLRPTASSTSTTSTAPVERKTISVLVSGTGSTVIADSVTVNPKISGTVEKLSVSLGETVTAGDELYTISASDVETQRLKAKASLLQSKQSSAQSRQSLQQAKGQQYSAETQLIKATQALADLESQPTTTAGRADRIVLAKRDVASASASVKAAKTSVTAASLGTQAASANLASAQQSYDDAVTATGDTVVTAPIDGVVTALPISVGSAVSAGTNSSSSSASSSGGSSAAGAASGSGTSSSGSSASSASGSLTISDLTTLDVSVSVSEVDVSSLSVGQKATLTFDALPDATFAGTVASISPNGTSSSGVVSYAVTITLDKRDDRLRPDMTATADIKTQVASNVLVVPSAAIKTSTSSEKYVEVVAADGSLTKKVVKLGVSDENYTEVTSGLTEGMLVSTGSVASSTAAATSTKSGGFMMGGPPGGRAPGGN